MRAASCVVAPCAVGVLLVPLQTTALAAGLGLVPLALSSGQAGREIQAPMAVVILCGLLSSTLLNMFVVPTLYRRFGALTRRSLPSPVQA